MVLNTVPAFVLWVVCALPPLSMLKSKIIKINRNKLKENKIQIILDCSAAMTSVFNREELYN